jgi:hypothetical protein
MEDTKEACLTKNILHSMVMAQDLQMEGILIIITTTTIIIIIIISTLGIILDIRSSTEDLITPATM